MSTNNKVKFILKNKDTNEEIDLNFDGTNLEEVYNRAKEIAGLKEIYYTRHTPIPTGGTWVDFGSYTWFIYII